MKNTLDLLLKTILNSDIPTEDLSGEPLKALDSLSISLKEQFSQIFQNLSGYLSSDVTVKFLTDQFKKMAEEAYAIDSAVYELHNATAETTKKYEDYLSSVFDSAYSLGTSASDLIRQATEWTRLGFSLDEATKLSEASSLYSGLTKVDSHNAIYTISEALKAFNLEVSDSIPLVDSLIGLGKQFDTDSAYLGETLKNTASFMSEAGNDIHQTLAMLAGSSIAPQDTGEFVDMLNTARSQLQEMKNEPLNLWNDNGSYESIYEQLEAISRIYSELNSSDRANLSESLFASHADSGNALLQAFESGQIQEAYEASLNSVGTAVKEQEYQMDSLEAKAGQLTAAFQSLSNTFLNSGFLKGIIDAGTQSIKILDDLTAALTPLGTAGLGTGLLGIQKFIANFA